MFDFDDLLELRGKDNTTTEATCFVSEQVSKILVLDGKIRKFYNERFPYLKWEFSPRL